MSLLFIFPSLLLYFYYIMLAMWAFSFFFYHDLLCLWWISWVSILFASISMIFFIPLECAASTYFLEVVFAIFFFLWSLLVDADYGFLLNIPVLCLCWYGYFHCY